MFSRFVIAFSVLFLTLFSCSQKQQFPSKIFEKTDLNNVVLNSPFLIPDKALIPDSSLIKSFNIELTELSGYKKYYEEKSGLFNLNEFEKTWASIKKGRDHFDFGSIKRWIEITGFLLEITGNEKYAKELEETAYHVKSTFSSDEIRDVQQLLEPWIFTKNLDAIYVNLFVNATIKYEHSMKGAVEITQETNYPESGRIQIRFQVHEKRYIELFIRIPDWAEGATVSEKGVKYVAPPGGYSQIYRKWENGDFVEIYLPKEKMHGYLKQ